MSTLMERVHRSEAGRTVKEVKDKEEGGPQTQGGSEEQQKVEEEDKVRWNTLLWCPHLRDSTTASTIDPGLSSGGRHFWGP